MERSPLFFFSFAAPRPSHFPFFLLTQQECGNRDRVFPPSSFLCQRPTGTSEPFFDSFFPFSFLSWNAPPDRVLRWSTREGGGRAFSPSFFSFLVLLPGSFTQRMFRSFFSFLFFPFYLSLFTIDGFFFIYPTFHLVPPRKMPTALAFFLSFPRCLSP